MLNNYPSDKKTGLLVWKAAILWQNSLKNILKEFSMTLNEFLILETLLILDKSKNITTQTLLSKSSGVDISVVSTVLYSLLEKELIIKKSDMDNRKKIIELTLKANSLLNRILPKINNVESNIFGKLRKEEPNFCNSLRLILGKKIKIKAER